MIRYYRSILFLLILLQISKSGFADDYPRNYNIDVVHYAFEFVLSDKTDEMLGKASITVLFKKSNIPELRLDFVNKTAALNGKGMTVDSVSVNDRAIGYTHVNDVLSIHLPNGLAEGSSLIFVIHYHGIPADGMRIGPTKYGDRSFF